MKCIYENLNITIYGGRERTKNKKNICIKQIIVKIILFRCFVNIFYSLHPFC